MPTRQVPPVLVTIVTATLLLGAPVAQAQTCPNQNNCKKAATVRPATPTIQDDRRPVFLTGRVKLDDGAEPAERIAIERVCDGRARREAYTDAHGAFGFQLGQVQIMQDASVGGSDTLRMPGVPGSGMGSGLTMGAPTSVSMGVSQRDLMGCELRALLSGYIAEPVDLAGRQLFDNPDVGTIVMHRMGKVEGTKISVTSMLAPADAKRAFARARNEREKNHNAKAEKQLQKAVALYPKFAEALSMLGEVYSEEGRNDAATKMFQTAMAADPHFMGPYFNLAVLAGTKRDWKQMAELTDRALELNPYEFPAMYLMNAAANYNLRNLGAAEKSARMVRRLDSQYRLPRADFILANVLIQRGDYAGCAEQLRSFLKHEPTGAESDTAREMLAQTESKVASGPPADAMAAPK
jgi:hypothetical protein